MVRGNTARRIVRMAREAGAAKVYLAITSPPLVSPCPYGIDMATKTEFIAAERTPREVAAQLEADYVLYLDCEAMNDAARVGNREIEHFCNACFTGEYPTDDITPEVLEAIGIRARHEPAEHSSVRGLVGPTAAGGRDELAVVLGLASRRDAVRRI